MRIRALLFSLAALALHPMAHAAGDIEAGKAAAAPCVACHGETGAEPISNYPIIAGQHESYLLRSMQAYRDGERNNAVMAQQMAGMSDAALANLAAYYASLASPLR